MCSQLQPLRKVMISYGLYVVTQVKHRPQPPMITRDMEHQLLQNLNLPVLHLMVVVQFINNSIIKYFLHKIRLNQWFNIFKFWIMIYFLLDITTVDSDKVLVPGLNDRREVPSRHFGGNLVFFLLLSCILIFIDFYFQKVKFLSLTLSNQWLFKFRMTLKNLTPTRKV